MAVRLLVLVGPTASGKTRLGVDVAYRLGWEIVSADSRQVYRGLDIGSGKDVAEYGAVTPAVPVHLIDVADPREVYSVFHYQRDCYRLMEQRADGPPLLMGHRIGVRKVIFNPEAKKLEIYNVTEDPLELKAAKPKQKSPQYKTETARLDRWYETTSGAAGENEMTEEDIKALKSLGYLQ